MSVDDEEDEKDLIEKLKNVKGLTLAVVIGLARLGFHDFSICSKATMVDVKIAKECFNLVAKRFGEKEL